MLTRQAAGKLLSYQYMVRAVMTELSEIIHRQMNSHSRIQSSSQGFTQKYDACSEQTRESDVHITSVSGSHFVGPLEHHAGIT